MREMATVRPYGHLTPLLRSMSIAKQAKPPGKSNKTRARRQPEQVRQAALLSARKLLLKHGPDAITLTAVARDLCMTHTNLIHHFGSAGELQSALMRDMAGKLTDTLLAAVDRLRSGAGDIREFVDIVFDAFDRGGAGRLAGWLLATDNAKLLAPIGQALHAYIEHIERSVAADAAALDLHTRVTSSTLFVVTSAFGDAMLGPLLCKFTRRERTAVRAVIKDLLPRISVLEAARAGKAAE